MSNENPAPTPEPTAEARTAATLETIRHAELCRAYEAVGFDAATAEQHARTNAGRFNVHIVQDSTDPNRLRPVVVDEHGQTAGAVLSKEYNFASHALHMRRFHAENSMGLRPLNRPVVAPGTVPLTGRQPAPVSPRTATLAQQAAIAFGTTQQGK